MAIRTPRCKSEITSTVIAACEVVARSRQDIFGVYKSQGNILSPSALGKRNSF